MSHSRLFADTLRALRIAQRCEHHQVSTREGLERAAAGDHRRADQRRSRRAFLRDAGLGLAAGGLALAARSGRARAFNAPAGLRVAIIGGGLAGLACADALRKIGVAATIYEGRPDRVGGRCWSNLDDFPGQVAEAGGEMIDTAHTTMLSYAREFHLELEDYNKAPGAPSYYFGGQLHDEAEVVDQFRIFVTRARADVAGLSAAPDAFTHNAVDVALDNTDLATYLATRAGDLPLLRELLDVAYVSEYGLACSQQSALNLLEFLKLDRRRKFHPYGSSDERYHVVGGNDQIPQRLAARLPGEVALGHMLIKLARASDGAYQLWFRDTPLSAPPDVTADAVVLAIPFTTLRRITLDPSLGLPAAQQAAIANLGYGAAGKNIVGFNGRPWAAHGSNGACYSDQADLQNTWETNWSRAGATAVLTDFFGGDRAAALQGTAIAPQAPPAQAFGCGTCHGPGSQFTGGSFFAMHLDKVNQQVDAMLTALDRVWPGARAAAARNPDGSYRVFRAHWQSQAFSRGCYVNYLPGQFTTIAGLEALPVGNLYFAGEHADSFYEWQGFLEGAVRSGLTAARSIEAAIRDHALVPLA